MNYQSYIDKRTAETKKNTKKLEKSLIGKKILSVETHIAWDGSELDSIRIKFDDGSGIELNGIGDGGCEECDPDGCKVIGISFYIKEKKDGT
jgi:hypothetical protein